MNAVLLLILMTLCFAGQSLSITVTYFSDNACKTPVPGLVQGVANPFFTAMNNCTLAAILPEGNVYVKPTLCSSSDFSFSLFGDSACSVQFQYGVLANKARSCITSNAPANAKSYRIKCWQYSTLSPAPLTPVQSSASSFSLFSALILTIACVM
jgi:hypothetical protein